MSKQSPRKGRAKGAICVTYRQGAGRPDWRCFCAGPGAAPSWLVPLPWPGYAALRTCCRTLRMRSSPFPRMRPDEGTEPDPAGGSGCAGHVPSLAGRPAGRHPDLITGGGPPARLRSAQPAAAPPGLVPAHDRGGFFAPNCAPSAEKQRGRRNVVEPRSLGLPTEH